MSGAFYIKHLLAGTFFAFWATSAGPIDTPAYGPVLPWDVHCANSSRWDHPSFSWLIQSDVALMPGKKFKLFTLIVVLVAFVVACCWYLIKPKLLADKGFLEIAQAPIWSDLQGIEIQHRSQKDLATPALLKGAVNSGKYDVLGMPSKSVRNPYVWVVLNTNAGINGIYTMPNNVDYALSCGYLHDLSIKENIDNKVMISLQSHCKN
jgi:hypothetical protein